MSTRHRWEWVDGRSWECKRCGKRDQPFHKTEKQTPCSGKKQIWNKLPTLCDYYPEIVDEDLVLDHLNARILELEKALERIAIAHETKTGACMKDAVAKLARKALGNK